MKSKFTRARYRGAFEKLFQINRRPAKQKLWQLGKNCESENCGAERDDGKLLLNIAETK